MPVDRLLVPEEPGDAADHVTELQLYWPHPCAEAWALDIEAASGGELEDEDDPDRPLR